MGDYDLSPVGVSRDNKVKALAAVHIHKVGSVRNKDGKNVVPRVVNAGVELLQRQRIIRSRNAYFLPLKVENFAVTLKNCNAVTAEHFLYLSALSRPFLVVAHGVEAGVFSRDLGKQFLGVLVGTDVLCNVSRKEDNVGFLLVDNVRQNLLIFTVAAAVEVC